MTSKYKGFGDTMPNRGTMRDIKALTPTSTPRTASTPRIASTATATSTATAPERDFQRVPNSITRRAIPEGLFKGKSKQVWDYLWSVTRGAIAPTRMTRKSRKAIKAGSGLGSMVTVDAAIEHLERVGLISIRPSIGSLLGNEYEVFTPEESSTRISSTSSISSPTQNLVDLDVPESSSSSTTQVIDSKAGLVASKTSFKTDTKDDDEAFADFIKLLRQMTKEVTGRDPSPADCVRWRELGELLEVELKVAAGRASMVSSAPALLVEHLRRRLSPKPPAKQPMQSSPPVAPSPITPAPVQSDEELVETFVTFLHGGMTVEDLDGQLSKSVEPERWPKIRAAVVERYEREQKHVISTNRDND